MCIIVYMRAYIRGKFDSIRNLPESRSLYESLACQHRVGSSKMTPPFPSPARVRLQRSCRSLTRPGLAPRPRLLSCQPLRQLVDSDRLTRVTWEDLKKGGGLLTAKLIEDAGILHLTASGLLQELGNFPWIDQRREDAVSEEAEIGDGFRLYLD